MTQLCKTGQRILIVEDETMIAMGLEALFESAGYAVVGPFGRIEQALAAARDSPIDAALLDVNLRGDLVFPVADVLRARNIPFAFLTGYGPDSLPPRYLKSRVFSKPVQGAKLVAAVVDMVPAHSCRS